jgi:transcriptional antiterminator NusG
MDMASVSTRAADRWWVLWTKSHCERLVRDGLASRGFEVFLPEIEHWSRRGGVRHVIRVPMFPGYLFLRSALDRTAHVEVRKARGLVALLGAPGGAPTAVPDTDVDSIQTVVASRAPVMTHPYLREGSRVRITRGPFADVEGILLRTKPNKGLLVISVELLRRSVAVEVDCTLGVPA